jgi:hypothetical protein
MLGSRFADIKWAGIAAASSRLHVGKDKAKFGEPARTGKIRKVVATQPFLQFCETL